MPTAYPTSSEVQTKCTEQGITAPSDIAGILAGVISDFELRTGFKPFKADDADTTWNFDPPWMAKDRTLDLQGGFVTITSIEIDGVAVDSDDYIKLPINASDESKGWTEIRFEDHPGFVGASVEIVGRRGLYTSIPYDVFQAILDEVVGRCSMTGASASNDIQSVKQGQMSVTYGAPDSMGRSGFAKGAAARFDAVVNKYRRLVI